MTTYKRRKEENVKDKLKNYFALLVLVVAVWELAILVFKLPSYIVPTPYSVFLKMTSSYIKILAIGTLITVAEIVVGFLMGMAVGGCLSLFIVFSKTGDIIRPLAISIKSVPKIALVPIILFALGQGFFPKCIIVAILCFFPILVSVTSGLMDIDKDVVDYCKTIKVGEIEMLRKVSFHFALPVIFPGLRSAFMYSVMGALLSEFFFASNGLGHLIWTGGSYYDMEVIYAGAIILSVVSIFFYEMLMIPEKKLVHWKKADEVYI